MSTEPAPTFLGFVASTMRPHRFALLAPRTRAFYEELFAAHIVEELGQAPLQTLTGQRLRAWQADRLKAGAGPANLNRALALVSMVLDAAIEDGLLTENAAMRVRRVPVDPRPAVQPLSPRTIERVRATMGLRDRTIVSLLAYAGVRPGELYALRWADVGSRTLHVQRAVDGVGGLKPTKSRKGRSIRLVGPLVNDLTEYRASLGEVNDLMFPTYRGNGTTTTATMANWRRRTWAQALAAAGVDYQRPYDLRHSFASLLLAAGHTVHYAAAQLGHSPKLTLSTYGHVIAEYEGQPPIDIAVEIATARDGGATKASGGTRARQLRRYPSLGLAAGLKRPWSLLTGPEVRPRRDWRLNCGRKAPETP